MLFVNVRSRDGSIEGIHVRPTWDMPKRVNPQNVLSIRAEGASRFVCERILKCRKPITENVTRYNAEDAIKIALQWDQMR